jgi:hypothetical protein
MSDPEKLAKSQNADQPTGTGRAGMWPRFSIRELMLTTGLLALDLAWFPGWLALLLAPVVILAVHHVMRRPIPRREVVLAIVAVVVVDASLWIDYGYVVSGGIHSNEEHVIFALIYVCGMIFCAAWPANPVQRTLQLVTTSAITIPICAVDSYRYGIWLALVGPLAFIILGVMTVRAWVNSARYPQPRSTGLRWTVELLIVAALTSIVIVLAWRFFIPLRVY